MRGKIKINKHKCKGCEYCIMYCPKKCIELSHEINNRGVQYAVFVDPVECIGCGICARVCPDVCIEVDQTKAVPLYLRMESTISKLIDSGLDKIRKPTQAKSPSKKKKGGKRT